MNRRQFLSVLGAGVWLQAGPDIALAQSAARPSYERLLILLELQGGNDGLNTLVPYGDPTYYRLRPRLAIARDQVVKLDEHLGLHPALAPWMALWQARELAWVQGVGYAAPNLSHFRSMEIWDTASDSDEYRSEGWLSRSFHHYPPPREFASDGVVVGDTLHGPLQGGARAVALSDAAGFRRQARAYASAAGAPHNAALAHILKVEQDIQDAAEGLQTRRDLRTAFPSGRFGHAVKTAAQVIASGANVAVIKISHGGFDTHSNQANAHARLLKELADGVMALRAALREIGRWDSTLIMSYSEFGRRARENQSAGTDHGTANVHCLIGGRVRGGLYGGAPSLTELDAGNLRHAVDFRQLYATVLESWWGVRSAPILGAAFTPLEIVRA